MNNQNRANFDIRFKKDENGMINIIDILKACGLDPKIYNSEQAFRVAMKKYRILADDEIDFFIDDHKIYLMGFQKRNASAKSPLPSPRKAIEDDNRSIMSTVTIMSFMPEMHLRLGKLETLLENNPFLEKLSKSNAELSSENAILKSENRSRDSYIEELARIKEDNIRKASKIEELEQRVLRRDTTIAKLEAELEELQKANTILNDYFNFSDKYLTDLKNDFGLEEIEIRYRPKDKKRFIKGRIVDGQLSK